MVDPFELMPMGTAAATAAVEAIERDNPGLRFDAESRAAMIRQGLLTEPQRAALVKFGADFPADARVLAGCPMEARAGSLRYLHGRFARGLDGVERDAERSERGRVAVEAVAWSFGLLLFGASASVTPDGEVLKVTVGAHPSASSL